MVELPSCPPSATLSDAVEPLDTKSAQESLSKRRSDCDLFMSHIGHLVIIHLAIAMAPFAVWGW